MALIVYRTIEYWFNSTVVLKKKFINEYIDI